MDGISSPTATFKHEPLPDAANHIRLLEVFGSDTVRVRCRITTWPTESTPSYYAISYAWGNSKSNKTILINDKAFQVRTNCELVLKQIHGYAKSRYYWIDAICIDQENLDEKSKQVTMMGNIYKKADHVLACVGDHADDSRFLLRNLEQFLLTVREPYPSPKSLYRRYGSLNTRRFVHASYDFATRPYFSRLWILQELKSAKQASILCGTDAVPKDELETLVRRLLHYSHGAPGKSFWKFVSILLRPYERREDQILQRSTEEIKDHVEATLLGVQLVLSPDVRPLHLVYATMRLQCMIPKDKVYGIISLLESGDCGSIIPDYTKSDFEVAVDLLRVFWNDEKIRSDSEFNPLRVCDITGLNLELSWLTSAGVPEPLEARHGPPRVASKAAKLWLRDPLPRVRTMAVGWRISDGDLTKDPAPFRSWKPPGPNDSKIYIPYWIEEGDWVLCWEEDLSRRLLLIVLREEAESLWMPVVGHAWCETFNYQNLIADAFEIHWTPEDALLFAFTRFELGHHKIGSKHWRRGLTTGVCRLETPGSSFGVKLPQESHAAQ